MTISSCNITTIVIILDVRMPTICIIIANKTLIQYGQRMICPTDEGQRLRARPYITHVMSKNDLQP